MLLATSRARANCSAFTTESTLGRGTDCIGTVLFAAAAITIAPARSVSEAISAAAPATAFSSTTSTTSTTSSTAADLATFLLTCKRL